MKLAIEGGEPSVKSKIPAFRGIRAGEAEAAWSVITFGSLSGYLGGHYRGGNHVEALEDEFSDILGVRHAVAVNSATSGLLAACYACGVGHRSKVLTTPYTMSATAAAPKHLGAELFWGDIEPLYFALDKAPITADAVIVTNLFGHPADLYKWRGVCNNMGAYLIEDNAQSPFALDGTEYAGTIGDIGVFSFNVHKHLQSGEGGICVTESEELANAMRRFRNHDELFPGSAGVGLNLRMTEVTAAIARAQLERRVEIIAGRIELAEELTYMAQPYAELFQVPPKRRGCEHVYYCWPLLVRGCDREWFVDAMNAEGVPLRKGYVTPLYKLPAFKASPHCPITENVERQMALFEVCAWNPTSEQRAQMREAFKKVCEEALRGEMRNAAGL